jgi:hypothetical protein
LTNTYPNNWASPTSSNRRKRTVVRSAFDMLE